MDRQWLVPLFTKTIRQVCSKPDVTVLDIGCGKLGESFRREFREGYFGTDIDESVKVEERMAAEDNHYENVFDVCTAFSVIEHTENPMIAVRKMFKACRVGVLLSTDFTEYDKNGDPSHLYAWTPKVFGQFLSKVGSNNKVWEDSGIMFGVVYK